MALLKQSETGHDPAEITSRRSMVLRPDIQKNTSGRIFMAIFVIT